VRRDEMKLARRQKAHGFREPDRPFEVIPEKL
jgi:hypothetical protein